MSRPRTLRTAVAVSLAALLAAPAAASARTVGNEPIPDQSRFQKVTLDDRRR